MLLKTFIYSSLAQNSYFVGCQETGEALVIDPARDIQPYLQTARDEGMTIIGVTETHIHADFVSGSVELAHATGARLYLSAEGGNDWAYAFLRDSDMPLHDSDTFMLGNVRFEVMHTPGHTPEHLVFVMTDTKAADQPMALFTGDCLFVGDMGRPDLLETAAGVQGSKEIGARGQFANMRRLRQMPDYLQVLPGHGAGSACGKALGAVPSSTLGYEKLFNPAFQFTDESEFTRWLLADQPETPHYFAHMKRINKQGVTLLETLSALKPMEGFMLPDLLRSGANVLDARPDLRDGTHIKGAIRIPLTDKFNTYAGWMVDYDRPTYLIAHVGDLPLLIGGLRAVGIDDVLGYFAPDGVDTALKVIPQAHPTEAQALIEGGALVLDVRASGEYADGHIPGAINIPYGMLRDHLDELPKDQPMVVHCASGVRSQIAASLLYKSGFTQVTNMPQGFDGWERAHLPVEQ